VSAEKPKEIVAWYAFCIFRTEHQEYGKLTKTVNTHLIKELKIDNTWTEVDSSFKDDSKFYVPEVNLEVLSGGKFD
jgi:hypothetical protein